MSCFSKEDLSFVRELPEHVQLECPICLHILTDPHLVSCCGHNFCGSCIWEVKARKGSCPICEEKKYQFMVNKERIRIINGLEVYCSNKEKGCQWKGEFKNMSTHLNKEKREGECQYEEVKCQYKKCLERMQRRYLKRHKDKECPQRPFECEHCGEEGTFLSITKDHYDECCWYPVTCPKECASTTMPRFNLEYHIENKCPLEPVDCVFSWAGCNDKPLRKDVDKHTADTKHMPLLAVACGQLKIESEQVKKENEKITEENRKITEENKKMKKEVKAIKVKMKENFEDDHVCYPDSYALLPIKIKSGSKAVHFYTGACGRHMSARVIASGTICRNIVVLLLAFHKGKYDKYNPKLPNLSIKYHFQGKELKDPFKVLEDTEAANELLPDDVLDTITSIDDIPPGVISRDIVYTTCITICLD